MDAVAVRTPQTPLLLRPCTATDAAVVRLRHSLSLGVGDGRMYPPDRIQQQRKTSACSPAIIVVTPNGTPILRRHQPVHCADGRWRYNENDVDHDSGKNNNNDKKESDGDENLMS